MVFPTGLEPVAYCLGSDCSIQLSYENIVIAEGALYYLSPGSTVFLFRLRPIGRFEVVDPLGLEPRTNAGYEPGALTKLS